MQASFAKLQFFTMTAPIGPSSRHCILNAALASHTLVWTPSGIFFFAVVCKTTQIASISFRASESSPTTSKMLLHKASRTSMDIVSYRLAVFSVRRSPVCPATLICNTSMTFTSYRARLQTELLTGETVTSSSHQLPSAVLEMFSLQSMKRSHGHVGR